MWYPPHGEPLRPPAPKVTRDTPAFFMEVIVANENADRQVRCARCFQLRRAAKRLPEGFPADVQICGGCAMDIDRALGFVLAQGFSLVRVDTGEMIGLGVAFPDSDGKLPEPAASETPQTPHTTTEKAPETSLDDSTPRSGGQKAS